MLERIQKVIDYLEGTCKSLSDACGAFNFDEEDLTMEELEQLDDQIFCCDACGWWSDIGDEAETSRNDIRVCDDCKDDV